MNVHSFLFVLLSLVSFCPPLVAQMPPTGGCSLLVDWSREVPISSLVRQFLVDYEPPQGRPPTHSVFPASTRSLLIEDAAPAADYSVNVSALFTDGTRRPILSTRLVSSPPTPQLEFLKADVDEVTFAFLAAAPHSLSFYIEYGDVDREQQTNHIETNKTALRIRQLEPSTRYLLRIFSVYRGVPSAAPLVLEFQTRTPERTTTTGSERNEDAARIPASESAAPHRWPTASPYGNLVTATANYGPSDERAGGLLMSGGYANRTPAPPFYAFSNSTPPPHWRQPSDSHLPELAPLEALGELMASRRSTTPIPPVESTTIATTTTTVDPPVERAIEHGETNVVGTTEAVGEPEKEAITTTESPVETVVDVGDVTDPPPVEKSEVKEVESTTPPPPSTTLSPGDVEEAAPEEQPADSIGGGPESGEIRASREGQQIRLDWEPPEEALCDNFLVNTTVVDLQPPRSFSTASGSSYSYVKFHSGHKLHIHVSCLYEGVVSSVWSAEKELDLRKPKPVENLRVKSMYTDEFYVSSVVLAIDWPRGRDFEQFEVSVVWAAGKKAIGSNKAVFNKSGDLLIEKLEPATMYTFAVRNVSMQLGLTSSPMGIRSTTPPIITSTLFPGQLSSYAININFGESEPEHKFDGYELVFAGNTRNITKKLAKSDPKSFTFNKLIPGRTYTFVLYTVYKNIKSRPVVEEITTYPLKVKSFNPIVGPGYVTLFWEVDNLGENECQFRLEYTSTSNTGIRKTQKTQLKDVNKYRFSGLDYDTYYTFTITVVMGRGKAEAESESEMVTIGFNQKPISLPTLQRRGSRELLLTFENDPRIFSDTNGVVDNFAIIVSEDLKLGGDDFHLKSYYDVKDELHWPAYRASVSTYNPFKKRGASRTATFVIGEEDCDRRKLSEQYCNGILRSHVDYYVKIRAYLVTNFAMETEWVSVHGLVDETPPEKGQRRLPCYMYLNGCSSASARPSAASMISAVCSLVSLLLLRCLF